MMSVLRPPLFALGFLLIGAVGPQAKTDGQHCPGVDRLHAEIADSLRALMDEHHYPGFSYAVAWSEGLILSGGVGVTDRAGAAPAAADTLYQIGSITKSFTGMLLALLAAEDRIDLGDTLSEHWFDQRVPAFSGGRPITLQDIATHTAGLPRYPDNLERKDGDPILGYSLKLMRDAAASARVVGDYPLPWTYSNFGYGVLAQALAQSQDAEFETLIAEHITSPLGLADTAFQLSSEQRDRLATPYRDDDVNVATQPWDMEAMSGAGGLYSTVVDLARFASWQLGGFKDATGPHSAEARWLQQAPLVRLADSPETAYGMGFFVVDKYDGRSDAVWHGGDVDGYAGSLVILPDENLAFVYLTNLGTGAGFADFQSTFIGRVVALCNPEK